LLKFGKRSFDLSDITLHHFGVDKRAYSALCKQTSKKLNFCGEISISPAEVEPMWIMSVEKEL